MPKKNHTGLKLFILSFLITFSVIMLVGVTVLMRVLHPVPVQKTESEIKRTEHVYSDNDSLTVLCIGYSRSEPQNAYYSIIRLDAPKKTVYITSLPDSMQISDLEGRQTLSELASYSGSAALCEELSRVLELPIDRWLRIEKGAFISLVDSLGAVTYDCEQEVSYRDADGFLAYSMSQGRHVFFGEKLWGLIKYSGNNQEQRANEQSRILASMLEQRLVGGSYSDPQELYERLIDLCDGTLNAFDFETRRVAIEQITEQKDLSFETVEVTLQEGKPTSDYLKALSVYR